MGSFPEDCERLARALFLERYPERAWDRLRRPARCKPGSGNAYVTDEEREMFRAMARLKLAENGRTDDPAKR